MEPRADAAVRPERHVRVQVRGADAELASGRRRHVGSVRYRRCHGTRDRRHATPRLLGSAITLPGSARRRLTAAGRFARPLRRRLLPSRVRRLRRVARVRRRQGRRHLSRLAHRGAACNPARSSSTSAPGAASCWPSPCESGAARAIGVEYAAAAVAMAAPDHRRARRAATERRSDPRPTPAPSASRTKPPTSSRCSTWSNTSRRRTGAHVARSAPSDEAGRAHPRFTPSRRGRSTTGRTAGSARCPAPTKYVAGAAPQRVRAHDAHQRTNGVVVAPRR